MSRPYRPRWPWKATTSIASARHLAAGFLTRVQAEYGLPVSQRATDLTQLVVSELVTKPASTHRARC
jgi:hypothetical protein